MIVSNHKNMLLEALRVLTPGGAACFTITGNPAGCKMLTTIPNVLRAKRSYFHLSVDGGE